LDYEYCDIRYVDTRGAQDKVDYVFNHSRKKIIIIIGHGNEDGSKINGLDLDLYEKSKYIFCIWLFACNSGKEIGKKLAKKGFNTLCFDTEILISDKPRPPEVMKILNYIKKIENVSFSKFVSMLRRFYYKESIKSLLKNDILQAAVLNHTRLALRAYDK